MSHGKNSKVDKAKFDEESESAKEGLHSEAMERLLLGGDLVPKNDSIEMNSTGESIDALANHSSDADFIAFPVDGYPTKPTAAHMGWSHYKGLGAALARCYRELNDQPLGTRCLGLSGSSTAEDKANLALSILDCYM